MNISAFCPYCCGGAKWVVREQCKPVYMMGEYFPATVVIEKERRAVFLVNTGDWLAMCQRAKPVEERPEVLRCTCGAVFYLESSRSNARDTELILVEIEGQPIKEYWLAEVDLGLF